MSPRKRFNPFDDLASTPPENAPQAPPKIRQPESDPTASIAEIAGQVERIERLAPSQMIPDRFQPRRLLPGSIRTRFFSGQIDCYTAAREWLAMARSDPGARAEVDRLLAMGLSIDEYGQIKPITGSWVPADHGRYVFQIETGERRYWAACLQAVHNNLKQEPLLRVEVVPTPIRQRQVIENRHAEPPSAVEQACEVAALVLSEMQIEPDPAALDEYDYFRQAQEMRMPAGLWDRVMPVMQLTRPRMAQLLKILTLPTPLLELADRYRIPERVLREILDLAPTKWESMLRTSIEHQLTAAEVSEAAERELPAKDRKPRAAGTPLDPAQRAFQALRRFARVLDELDHIDRGDVLDELADRLVMTGLDDDLNETLDELMTLIGARRKRR